MDLPPTRDPRGGSTPPDANSVEARELAEAHEANRTCCAADAARLRHVARIVKRCRSEVQDRVLALGETDLDVDAEMFAHRMCVDAVMCAFGIGQSEATRLVHLADRLTVLPAVWEAWSAGVLDAWRVRVLAEATDVLDDATARAVAGQVLAQAGDGPWDGLAPRQWRTRVEQSVVAADAEAAERRRAAAVAARRVRSWKEGDGSAVLAVHAGVSEIAMADRVVSDLARAWPATDPDGVRLTMDQRRTDALLGLLRAVRDHSLADQPAAGEAGAVAGAVAGSAFAPGIEAGTQLPRVPVRRVHDLGLVLHADTLFNDGPAADATGQLRGLGHPDVLDPASARTLARQKLSEGIGVQVLVVDGTGAVERVVRLDRDTARSCGSRQALIAAVRQQLAASPPLETDIHDPSEAIARHVRAAAPTCSFYDCPRQARSCDLDHDTPWPRGPTSVTNLDPKCRRHHHAKTLGLVHTRLTAGPGTGRRTVHWTLPAGIQVTTSPEPLPGVLLRPTPTAS
jgi:hypothetical protein